MTVRKFKARKGSPFSDKDATVIGNFINKVFPDGSPDPKTIVEIAKDRKCPIHKYFEWDDRKAAEKYRIQQAQRMIQMVYIEISPDTEIRQWENVVIEGHRRYQDSDTILRSPELVDQVMQKALEQLTYFENKFKVYRSLKPLLVDIEKVRKKHETKLKVKAKKPTTKKKRKVA